MLVVPTSTALAGALLSYTGLAQLFGFSVLPTRFFLRLFGMVVIYLVLVEATKVWFFRRRRPRLAGVTVTRAERIERRIHERASRFNSHGGPILH
jgi:hypothetical protein